jgi:signal transduction histidine kinase
VSESTAGEVLAQGRSRRIDDAARQLRIPPERLGLGQATTALLVPLVYRGQGLGVLAAFDRLGGDGAFTVDDEELLEAFAAQAATAVATGRSVEADRRRRSLAAAEAERHRWARELPDETLQALGALKLLVSTAARLDDPAPMRDAMRQAGEQLTNDIDGLRSLIAELRPPALEELGLAPALASLARRTAGNGLAIGTRIELPEDRRLAPEIETTIYRVVQESLTNIVKHARATSVELAVRWDGDEVELSVSDDGVGFDPEDTGVGGFGLAGMHERVELAGGELTVVRRADAGTVVHARLPAV